MLRYFSPGPVAEMLVFVVLAVESTMTLCKFFYYSLTLFLSGINDNLEISPELVKRSLSTQGGISGDPRVVSELHPETVLNTLRQYETAQSQLVSYKTQSRAIYIVKYPVTVWLRGLICLT